MHSNGRKENMNSESSRKTQTQPFKTSNGGPLAGVLCGHLLQGKGLFLLTASRLQFPKGLCSLDEGASSSKELALKFSSSLTKAIPLTIQSKQSHLHISFTSHCQRNEDLKTQQLQGMTQSKLFRTPGTGKVYFECYFSNNHNTINGLY